MIEKGGDTTKKEKKSPNAGEKEGGTSVTYLKGQRIKQQGGSLRNPKKTPPPPPSVLYETKLLSRERKPNT